MSFNVNLLTNPNIWSRDYKSGINSITTVSVLKDTFGCKNKFIKVFSDVGDGAHKVVFTFNKCRYTFEIPFNNGDSWYYDLNAQARLLSIVSK